MKKLIYLLGWMFLCISCIDDSSDLGGNPISRLSFAEEPEDIYTVEHLADFSLTAPDVVQEQVDKPLSYEWQVNYKVVSVEKTLSYKCLTCGVFPCRLKVSNEDGAVFKDFTLKVPYPYEEGVLVLSSYDGRSMLSFRNVGMPGEHFDKDVYQKSNADGVTLGKTPRSVLYNADYASVYIATEDPVKVVRVDARTMEALNVLNYPESRVERMIEKGETGVIFWGGGRILDMDCRTENYVNTLQQGLTGTYGWLPDAYISYAAYEPYGIFGSFEIVYLENYQAFLKDNGGAYQVFEELPVTALFYLQHGLKSNQGVIVFDTEEGVNVAHVNWTSEVILGTWPEKQGRIAAASCFTMDKKETILYYTHGNQIYRYDYESDGNFPEDPTWTVGEEGDVIRSMVTDAEGDRLYVALDAKAGEYKGCVYCYDLTTKEEVWHERNVAGEVVQMIYKTAPKE